MIKYWTDFDIDVEGVIKKRTFPVPSGFVWQFSDLDKTAERNDAGLLNRERIGSKTKLSVTWQCNISTTKLADLIRILKSLPPFFYISYPDPGGTYESMECYRGDITVSLTHYDYTDWRENIWRDLTVNFIER